MKSIDQKPEVDVLLLLEGSYPYVAGGVSSWMHTIIQGFPDYRFGVIFMGGQRSDYDGLKYELPHNVVHIETHYLFDSAAKRIDPKPCRGNPNVYKRIEELHDWCAKYPEYPFHPSFCDIDLLLDPHQGVNYEHFLHSKCAWQYISKKYLENSTDNSFIDYFWTLRQIHHPLWIIANIVAEAPKAKLYHAISTGYAGYMGALLHYKNPTIRLVLTEHGLYTKERHLDLLRAPWEEHHHYTIQSELNKDNYFQQLWQRFFASLGRFCYEAANPIISLYHATNQYQIEQGAKPERTMIIPNGTHIDTLAPLKPTITDKVPPIICLVGRVVPIKDIKTFIHASSRLKKQMPDLQAWIVGPMEEDEEYANSCQYLVRTIAADEYITFWGQQDIRNILPRVGLVVLSSISEGLPLIILESFATGIPVITTDVGACRELIHGKDSIDQQLGSAGEVVSIANPRALADSCYRYLSDKSLWLSAQQVAETRVKKYYDLKQVFAQYRQIYEDAIIWQE